jgi:hypothetical protein
VGCRGQRVSATAIAHDAVLAGCLGLGGNNDAASKLSQELLVRPGSEHGPGPRALAAARTRAGAGGPGFREQLVPHGAEVEVARVPRRVLRAAAASRRPGPGSLSSLAAASLARHTPGIRPGPGPAGPGRAGGHWHLRADSERPVWQSLPLSLRVRIGGPWLRRDESEPESGVPTQAGRANADRDLPGGHRRDPPGAITVAAPWLLPQPAASPGGLARSLARAT